MRSITDWTWKDSQEGESTPTMMKNWFLYKYIFICDVRYRLQRCKLWRINGKTPIFANIMITLRFMKFKFWIHWNMEYCNKLITLIFCSTFISYSTVISYSTFYCSKILDNLQLPFERRGHFEFRSKFIFCVQWINYLMNICIRWTKLYWEKFEYNINLKYMKVPYLLYAIYIPM